MEVVTYVLEGALEHKDSMGNGEVLRPGEFQRMSAGSGMTHSEFTPSSNEPTHLYQIWLLPQRKGIEPSYEQKPFDDSGMEDQLRLVASPSADHGSLTINRDAQIFLANLNSPPNSRRILAEFWLSGFGRLGLAWVWPWLSGLAAGCLSVRILGRILAV